MAVPELAHQGGLGPCTRPGSGSTGGAGGGAQRWLRPGLCHWPCVTLPPQSPGLSPSLEGTRCDSRNRASIPEPKGSHHLHFQLPRAAHRMPGRPPARRSILLHHPGSGRGQGCTGAAAGNALLDPMAVNSPGEASAALLPDTAPAPGVTTAALDEAGAVSSHPGARHSAEGHDPVI